MRLHPSILLILLVSLSLLSPTTWAGERADFEALCTCSGPPECGGGQTYDSSTDIRAIWNVPIDFDAKRQESKAKYACKQIMTKYCEPHKSLTPSGGTGSVSCTVSAVSYRQIGATPATEPSSDRKTCEVPVGFDLKEGALIHIQDTDLPGIRVWHGTSSVDVASIKAGPKNIGDGLSGPGLYLALFDESGAHLEVAGTSATDAVTKRGGEEAILSGVINHDADACVISLQTTRSDTDLSRGWIGGYWERRLRQPEMVPWIMGLEVMDLKPVDLDEGAGGANLNQRILVIHESAGADIIQWDP